MNEKNKKDTFRPEDIANQARQAEGQLYGSGRDAEFNVKTARQALTRAEILEELILLSERGEIKQSQAALKKCTLKDLNRIK